MTFRYLTFDCYGTLIDWRAGIEASLAAAVGGIHLKGQALLDAYISAEKIEEQNYQKYREVLRRSALMLSKPLAVKVSPSAAERFAGSVPDWPAFEDSAGFLREVGKRGYRRYILSNVDTDLLEGTIKKSRLEVDGYVTAEEVGSYKPNPGHWLRFFEKAGARKGEVLHIAQSIFHDILPTQSMGVASAWVNRYREPMPKNAHPLIVSDTLANLGRLLESKQT